MSIETFNSFLGLAVAAIGCLATIAGLSDDGRARLARWTKSAANSGYRIARRVYMTVSLVNGLLGVLIFGIQTTPPTRKDILGLVLFLANIAIGVWLLNESANRVAAAREQAQAK